MGVMAGMWWPPSGLNTAEACHIAICTLWVAVQVTDVEPSPAGTLLTDSSYCYSSQNATFNFASTAA